MTHVQNNSRFKMFLYFSLELYVRFKTVQSFDSGSIAIEVITLLRTHEFDNHY